MLYVALYTNMTNIGYGTKNSMFKSSQRIGLFQDYETMDDTTKKFV